MKKVLISAAFAVFTTNAVAHSWYDPVCCSTKDCAAVVPDVVSIEDGHYVVTVGPGDHPFVTSELTRRIPFDHPDVKDSQDSDFHVCANSHRIICLYVPLGMM